MKAILAPAFLGAAALVASPAIAEAQATPDEPTPVIYLTATGEVLSAVRSFFDALRSDDKSALAKHMLPEGVIFVHNRMTPDAPRVDVVPVAKHLENWTKSPPGLDEKMRYDTVLIDGDMAQVWGPYRFTADGKTTHCGINSLSLVKTESGWKIANTSFTMEPPSECGRLRAPEAPAP